MAAGHGRRRLSFMDFAHPQLWQQISDYSDMTIAMTKLSSFIFSVICFDFLLISVNNFTNQWAKICLLASSQLHQLVVEFRRKTEQEIRRK